MCAAQQESLERTIRHNIRPRLGSKDDEPPHALVVISICLILLAVTKPSEGRSGDRRPNAVKALLPFAGRVRTLFGQDDTVHGSSTLIINTNMSIESLSEP
jgi:hypothetical protein